MVGLELQSVVAHWHKGEPLLGHSEERSVSFSAKPGEWLGIIGENGIGKSTLLHAIAGTASYVAGRVLMDRHPLRHRDSLSRFRAGIQHVPQHAQLKANCSTLDARDLIRTHRPAYFNELAINELFKSLEGWGICSGGHLSPRIFDLAVSILSVPRVLLLDEIRPAWPEPNQAEVYTRIRDMLPSTTVLFVDHNIHQILQNANRVLLLKSDAAPTVKAVTDEEIQALSARADEKAIENPRPESDHLWTALRLDRSPGDELRLALQAKRGTGQHSVEKEIYSTFPFLRTPRSSECLSGGQRIVLLSLFLELSGHESIPDTLLRHLDSNRLALLTQIRRKISESTHD